jgi:hypothetical protein
MSPDEEPRRDNTLGLVEPEGVNAASSDPEQDAPGEHVVSSSGAPQDSAPPQDAAPVGDSGSTPPDERGKGPGQELSVGEG